MDPPRRVQARKEPHPPCASRVTASGRLMPAGLRGRAGDWSASRRPNAQRFPARPRPHHPFHRLPAPEAQDASVRGARGGSLPDPPDPHYRGGADRALDRRSLGLDEDLSEALALAHDLGHTPFGHTGEDALDALMGDFGGFRPQRAGASDRDAARTALRRFRRAQPDLGDARGSGEAQRALAGHER